MHGVPIQGRDHHADTSPRSKRAGPDQKSFGDADAMNDLFIRSVALAAAPDPIITINADGLIQSANESFHRVLGWSASDLVGQNVQMLRADSVNPSVDGLSTGSNLSQWPRRFDAIRRDGSRIPIECRVAQARLPDTLESFHVAILRDASEDVAAEHAREEERASSLRQLAEHAATLDAIHMRLRISDRMASIGTLAAGLGHDMNNVLLPVRARLNALKAAARTGQLNEPNRKHVEEIGESIDYLQQLADGLHFLAMDPDTDGNIRGGGAATELHAWWRQAGPLLSKAVPKHVRVTASFPPGLPRVALPAHSLTQAILNLIVNAGEAIPSSRKRRQGLVHLHAQIEDAERAWVRISVSDNGPGMSEDVQRRAFEMFFTTKPRGLGTGLGLALVRQIVGRAGGTAEIISHLGKGATVALSLPPAPDPGPSVADSNRTVLVSITDVRTAAFVCQILKTWGLQVHTGLDPLHADVWIASLDAVPVDDAKTWCKHHPAGSLMLLGPPENASATMWNSLDSLPITDPRDLDSLRNGLRRAVATS